MVASPVRTVLDADALAERRARFRALHASGCFVIPNPWDIGSAKLLAGLGFQALASTSAGFAFSRGLPDGAPPLADHLAHLKELSEATDLPVNADFENAYAHDPEAVAENVAACAGTGVSGLSVEDYPGEGDLYPFDLALARVKAAVAALKGSGVMLVARCEAHLRGTPDAQAVALKRLSAFIEAGVDIVYAPGLKRREDIAEIVRMAGPIPVNLLIGSAGGLTVAEAADLGVRRISVGGSLARAALGGFLRAAREIAQKGAFDAFAEAEPGAVLNGFFSGAKGLS